MKVSNTRFCERRRSLLEVPGALHPQLTKHHTNRTLMGNEQSSTKVGEDVNPGDGDSGVPPITEAANTRLSCAQSDASTQTDYAEGGGYDMRAPRRKRSLFGVVAVAGVGGGSMLPNADAQRRLNWLWASLNCLRRLVRDACECRWIDKV